MTPATYVPVLRSRAAERDAIRSLDRTVRSMTAPLFEICKTTARSWVSLRPREVARAVFYETFGSGGRGDLYIDLRPLLDRGDASLICIALEDDLLTLNSQARLVFTIAEMSRKEGVASAKNLIERNGAAFRVTRSDLVGIRLNNFRELLRKMELDARSVDLIVDFEFLNGQDAMRSTVERLHSALPWRSVTYLGGSFPPNLTALKKNDQYELPRNEWNIFFEEQHGSIGAVGFGDYTVQNPFQPDPPPHSLPSASIRYTGDDHWVVMRGEKLDNPKGPGYPQYIAQAQLLCERPEYQGRDFSAGDEYIHHIANQVTKTGNPKKWLEAAINHHVTFAARQLRAAAA
jgi:hypothetical protein